MRELINKLSACISKENNYSEEKTELVDYALRIIIFESLKAIAIISIFAIVGYLKPCLIILAIIASTKPFIGGYHEDTQVKCFIATTLIVVAIAAISFNARINLISLIILCAVSMYAIYHQAPITDENMPITKEDIKKKNRNTGLIVIGLWIISFVVFRKHTLYITVGTFTIVFQALLMFQKKVK